MDFARLSLPQVLDLERFARLAGALRACELGLELYDATGRVVVPLPKDAGPCGQAEGCPQARRELAAAVVRARAAQTQPCAPQGLLVGVPVQPFTTCLGALVACRPAAPAAVAAATVALLEQLLEQSVTVAVQQLEIENLASELLARYEQLTFLFDLGRFVNPADEPARVFDLVTRQLLRLYDASYVATVFHRGAIRQFAVAEGSQAQAALAAEAQRLCQHLAERVQACRRVIVLNDLRALAWEPPLRFTAVLAAPILVDEQCYGTLNLLATAPERPFLNGDIALLELVSKQVGIFLENHRLYERLAAFHQAQKMEALGRLAGGIAHDFNNILSAILGYGEMLRDDLPEGSGLRENAVRLLQAAERAKALVQQILSFSRQQKPARQRVSLVEVAQEALALLRPSLPETIALRHRFETAPATVLGDPTQLHQVLMNLCTNAVQAMREGGGVLEVGLELVDLDAEAAARQGVPPGAYICLAVSDTGCGMPPEVLERIFEPFFTTKPAGQGTGMGLAVVHGIVQSYGGTITVASTPGQGTTFRLFFPTVGEEAAAAAPAAPKRILLVDDDEHVLGVARQMLERLGYTVAAFSSSVAALEAFRQQPQAFDAVLTDQRMPELTGEALTRELLRLRPGIPVVLMTGCAQAFTEEQARAAGIRAYLTKPITLQVLGETLAHLLE